MRRTFVHNRLLAFSLRLFRGAYRSNKLMRQIGRLSEETLANRFRNYLTTKNIETQIDAEGEEWLIWVFDDDQVEDAKTELAAFRESPDDDRFVKAATLAADIEKERQKVEKKAKSNVVKMSGRWKNRGNGETPLTLGLIAISILITLLTNFGSSNGDLRKGIMISTTDARDIFSWPEQVQIRWSDCTRDIREGQIWRLVTPIFLHLSPLHLVFNMLWLYQLGLPIEARKGTWMLLFFVLFTAIISNFLQFLVNGPAFGGMSGVVYGLFGYLWMKSTLDPSSGFMLPPMTVAIMIGWLFLCFTGMMGPVANTAHLVGLICGIVLGAVPTLMDDLRRARN